MKSDPLLGLNDLDTRPQWMFIGIERSRIHVCVHLFFDLISECRSHPHKHLNGFLLVIGATPHTRCTPRWCEILFIVFILFNEKFLLCELLLQFLLFLTEKILLHVVSIETENIDFAWVFFERGWDIRVQSVHRGFRTLGSFSCCFHDYFELIIHLTMF